MTGPISRRRELGLILLLMALALVVRLPGVFSRSLWYDEAISLLETSGHSRPTWPDRPTPAAAAKANLVGTASLSEVFADLKRFDTHPPVYFLTLSGWRQGLGFSIEAARGLSMVFSLISVLLLYALLRMAAFEHPFGATLFYALATGAVHHGHEARPYAMAEALILTSCLFGFWAWNQDESHTGRALVGAALMAISAGAAFGTDYLALFPVGALMIWFLWANWSRNRLVGLAGSVLTIAIGGLVLPVLRAQLESRAHQFSGFVGPFAEMRALLGMNAQEIGIALSVSGTDATTLRIGFSNWVPVLAVLGLALLSGFFLRRQDFRSARHFWVLMVALAAAPTVGLGLMDLALDKELHEPRYLAFAVPALAVLLSYGALNAAKQRQRWATILFVGMLAVQVARVNWGFDRCVKDQTGSITRSLVEIVEGVEAPSQLVAVAAGFGQGDPAVWAYELGAATPMLVFDPTLDPRRLQSYLESPVDLWIAFSSDKATLPMEQALVQQMEASEKHILVFRNRAAIRFIRRP